MRFRLAAFVALLSVIGCGHVTVPQGKRIGTIIKCSDQGWWHKTHEIEIVRGGLNAASGGFGVKPFYATVTDEYDWQLAQKYFDSQQEVEISYTETFLSLWASECAGEDEDCAFVTGIKPHEVEP